jgi:methyltransferase (TIGR00027 family)
MPVPGVTTTARWAAAQRARESQRPDCLFSDLLASSLAGQEGTTALELSEKVNPRHAETAAYIAIRVKFLDDFMVQLASEDIRQVVLLAAGMDARAFRLGWPAETSVYELDHPELLEMKAEILNREGAEAACRRVVLGADLRQDWAACLEQAGFHPSEPSIWILEGLLYYLPEESVHRMFQQISKLAAKGSGLGADLVSQSTLTSPWMQAALNQMEKSGFAWKFGTDDPEGFFERYGWNAEVRQLGEEGASFGRWKSPVVPRTQKELPRTFLVAAHKK